MKSFKTYIAESNTKTRIRVVKARIRNGKVQRRVRVSGVKGYTVRGGVLVRISPIERLHRKAGARKGKIRRRAKMARIVMKRSRTMRRRKSMGL